MRVHMRAHFFVYVHVSLCTYICACMHVYIYMYMHICTYEHIYIYICIHIYIYVYAHVDICLQSHLRNDACICVCMLHACSWDGAFVGVMYWHVQYSTHVWQPNTRHPVLPPPRPLPPPFCPPPRHYRHIALIRYRRDCNMLRYCDMLRAACENTEYESVRQCLECVLQTTRWKCQIDTIRAKYTTQFGRTNGHLGRTTVNNQVRPDYSTLASPQCRILTPHAEREKKNYYKTAPNRGERWLW